MKFDENSLVESLSSEDKSSLEIAKLNKRLATAIAEKAIAQNEVAEINYRYLILQIYMKYGLTTTDSIDEKGNIIRKNEASTGDENENF